MYVNIFSDEFYKKCILLAKNSKSNYEKYGSLIVKDNVILGEGFNRAIVHPNWEKNLIRIIRQGYANHAEIESLNNALEKNFCVDGADIYVAGFFNKTKKLFLHKEFTCVRCLPYLEEYGIQNIYVPSLNGWVKRPLNEAKQEAKNYLCGTNQNRINSCEGDYFLYEYF